MSDQPFDSQNAAYAQLLYEQYALNPDAVPPSWRDFFDQGPDVARAAGLIVPDGLSPNGRAPTAPTRRPARAAAARRPTVMETEAPPERSRRHTRALRRLLPVVARATSLVQAFRDHGHMLAQLDPLGAEPPGHPQLDPSFFGTSMEELQDVPAALVMDRGARDETVAEALQRLRTAYAGYIGYEFEHIEDPQRVRWLWDQVESGRHTRPLEDGEKVELLRRLSEVEGFEQFLHRAFLGQKRFSIEGTDMMVPMLDLALERAAAKGARHVVLGMAHRGRLNVLAHVVGVGYDDIVREFEGGGSKGQLAVPGTGDVKYHHGAEGRRSVDGRKLEILLAPNPSHLEFVNPVVLGMTRFHQFGTDTEGATQETSSVVPILIHGDAAFAAEGVVAETLNLGRLTGYSVGGTIHIIANNQIGFTTDPSEGRSTRYASDLAKGYDFPIIHVNADRPDACLSAMRLAMEYRAEYGDDVVIDLVGYRRHGHNEGDEPAYTQPTLYQKIDEHATVRERWAERLIDEGVLTEAEEEEISDSIASALRDVHDRVKEETDGGEEDAEAVEAETEEADAGDEMPGRVEAGVVAGPRAAEEEEGGPDSEAEETGVPLDEIVRINEQALSWPEDFSVHAKLRRSLDRRREDFGADTPIDWAQGETIAFGSLLEEGYVVRLTGQDSQRGTFSQRHLVLHDPESGREYTPLCHVGAGRFEIYNSPLTEAAVVGYEYGYSVASERDLVLWEAQFGDFVNAAQVAIDQFISSGREKWDQEANLTLLLPHGYEGQGPEHSSARLERFLQLCAESNMRVVYPTTPAQYFHLLRRQAHTRPERPLIVMTPKSLLRLPAAASRVEELTEGRFRPVLDDPDAGARRDAITRLILCTGKVYYDIQGHDGRDELEHVAVARIEELYPFPSEGVTELVERYPNLGQVVWVQEEPRNMGALTFVGPRLRAAIPRHIPLGYAARPERASPAEGHRKDHVRNQERIVREALGVEGSGGGE